MIIIIIIICSSSSSRVGLGYIVLVRLKHETSRQTTASSANELAVVVLVQRHRPMTSPIGIASRCGGCQCDGPDMRVMSLDMHVVARYLPLLMGAFNIYIRPLHSSSIHLSLHTDRKTIFSCYRQLHFILSTYHFVNKLK